jgi:hypothetical protein
VFPFVVSRVSFWVVPARRLVVTSGPESGTMEQTYRQISRRVRAAREQAIIGYGYGKRG